MTRYYITTPFCDICSNREEAAGMIADAITDSDAARTAYDVFCAGNEFYYADDNSGLEEWATYEAYDLLDKAERCGRSAAYGVTVYANAKAAALEECASDAFDPWCGPELRSGYERRRGTMIEIPIKRKEPVMRWIPVSERLPEEGKQVLVCDDFGSVYIAEYEASFDGRWYEPVEYQYSYDIVAWMPLPEPWRGESNDRT